MMDDSRGVAVINDRHLVTAGEAAYANGLGATYLLHKAPYYAEVNPVCVEQPELMWLYHVCVKVVDSSDQYRQGLLVSIGSIIPNDTGSMPLSTALQSSETEFANFIAPQGYPCLYGLRWRIWYGLAAGDLVILRAIYKRGARL